MSKRTPKRKSTAVLIAVICIVVLLSVVTTFFYRYPLWSIPITNTKRLIIVRSPGIAILKIDIEPEVITNTTYIRRFVGIPLSIDLENKVILRLKVIVTNFGGDTLYTPVIAISSTMCRCTFFGSVKVETEKGEAYWVEPIICLILCPPQPLYPGTKHINDAWIFILEPSKPLKITVKVTLELCKNLCSVGGALVCCNISELNEVFTLEIS